MNKGTETIRAIAPDVARELTAADGQSWVVEASKYDHDCMLAGPDGARIHLAASGRNSYDDASRIEASGNYPLGAYSEVYPGLANVRATVATERGAKAIAKAIATRVLPEYRAELARAQAALRKRDEAEVGRAKLGESLSKLAPGAHVGERGHGTEVSWGYELKAESNYQGTAVTIVARDLSPDLAKKILRMIHKAKADG
ncbi:MAG TPA: hypothetical protein VK735_39540 [Pseudonocardia sp.]|uniref:hypothetical protein n=1 Tax=Pseudonocardia sp. TaxID=60912 RepID=UPI002C8637B1|nr:hypothetical protein [Pseudonocardia sp.]HTF53576.1 hypothetical protein [Pseudonocardia sp.]